MKPSIVNWVYVGLIYVLLDKCMDIMTPYLLAMSINDCFVQMPCIVYVLIAILSVIALAGLARVALWARTISIIVICAGVASDLVFIIYPFLASKGEIEIWRFIPPLSLIDIPLLSFLAYKIYSSDSFKYYLS